MARTPLVGLGPELDAAEIARYSRQLRMPQLGSDGQRRLKAARVLVLGAGGLGSPILLYLAAAGVGTLGIVDDDTVDASNLQRQIIHSVGEVGGSKARSSEAAIARLNPLVSVELHEVRLDLSNARGIFAGYDLVIDGTDNFATRYVANDTAADLGMPYVWGSVLRFDGQVSTFWHRPAAAGAGGGDQVGSGLTLRDLFPSETADDAAESCSVAGVLGPLCGSVGAAMATEALKLVVGFGEPLLGRILVIDALEGSYTEVPFAVAPQGDDAPPVEAARGGDAPPVEAASGGDATPSEAARGGDAPGSTADPRHAADAASGSAPDGAPTGDGVSGGAAVRGAAPSLPVAQLAARLEARASGTDDFILLDVRDPWEHDLADIPGSVLVPLPSLLSDAAADKLPKESAIVVYCHLDVRSQYAREVLLQSGWQNVTFVEGGIEAWSRQIDPEVARY